MTHADILAAVTSILCDQLACEPAAVTSAAYIVDDLGADSLDVIELIRLYEETFDVVIPDAALENGALATVGETVEYIDHLLKERQ